MDMFKYEDRVYDKLVHPMTESIEEWEEGGYTRVDVENCKEAVFDYLNNLDMMYEPSDEEILEAVRILVVTLNEINESTEFSLIEAEARENLLEIIQDAAIECGLKDVDRDITEDWREW